MPGQLFPLLWDQTRKIWGEGRMKDRSKRKVWLVLDETDAMFVHWGLGILRRIIAQWKAVTLV